MKYRFVITIISLLQISNVLYAYNTLFLTRIDRNGRKEKTTQTQLKPLDILLGTKIGSDTTEAYLQYNGILQIIPEYNFVDGAWVGQKVSLFKKLDSKKSIKLTPYLYYTWGRNTIIYGNRATLQYLPSKEGKAELSFGSVTQDFNPKGINRFDNTIASAIHRESDIYLYLNNFVSIKNSIHLTHSLTIETAFEIAKRKGLKNHASWGIWGNPRKIRPNRYVDQRFDKTSYAIILTYNGNTQHLKQSPVIQVFYKEGFGNWKKNNSRFRKIAFKISQKIPLSNKNKVDYKLESGGYLGNKDHIHFTDYYHFNTSKMQSISKWPYKTFMLLNNYEASTKCFWIEGFFNLETENLFLKKISILRHLPFTENLHFKALYTPEFKTYTEIGYSIDIKRLVNIGIHSSFIGHKHHNLAFRISYIIRDILKAL